MRKTIRTGSLHCLLLSILATYSNATPLYFTPGPNLTYGNVSHSQRIGSSSGNPSAPAAAQSRGGTFAGNSAMLAVGAGIEYGSVNNLFQLIDKTSGSLEASAPPSGSPGGPTPDAPEEDTKLKDALETLISNNPDVDAAISAIQNRVTTLGSSLLLIASKGYGKAFATADAPIAIDTDVFDGTIQFSASAAATSKVAGLADPIQLDRDNLRAQLDAITQLPGSAPATEIQLGPKASISVDLANNDIDLNFNNDSLLITKAAKLEEYAIGYSHPMFESTSGNLFLGVKPKYIRAGLTRVGIRFGDISDSEALFDDIKNADFRYDSGFSIDLGAMWVSNHYQLGASFTNVNEPTFRFPEIDTRKISNPEILSLIEKDSIYEMERQLKLEAGLFTIDKKWTFNAALDANAAKDPMGDNYQWASVSTGYASQSWWIPGIRTGLHHNLAGTELSYLSAGVTLFKYLDIDVSSALDTVKIEDQNLPRGLNLSIGLAVSF